MRFLSRIIVGVFFLDLREPVPSAAVDWLGVLAASRAIPFFFFSPRRRDLPAEVGAKE
jgi:hypothetical protein